MVTSERQRPTFVQPLPKKLVDPDAVIRWFEVALCEQGDNGQVIVKDIQKTFEPEYTFHEGLLPDKYYAMAIRRLEVRKGKVFIGDWTDLTEWKKPNRSRHYE